jgi:tRNA(Ile)-lysidine synthase
VTEEHAADPLLDALAAAQAQHHLFAPLPATVVVGVSGGADSVCLLHALASLADAWSLTLHVAHVDHALRPTAAADAAFVRDLAQTLHLPFHLHTLAPGELAGQPGGLEAAARQVRLHFLRATAINVTPPGQVPHIALAHHADDQAETLLLHLIRGAGLRGLGAMRPATSLQSDAAPAGAPPVRIVRPLLGLSRADLRAYLARHRLAWREDPTNADAAIARNRLRHEVLPQLAMINPAAVEVICRTAELLAGEADRIDARDAALLAQLCVAPADAERVLLNLDGLRRLSPPDQRGVLRRALAQLLRQQAGSEQQREIGFHHVEAVRTHLLRVAGASGPHPVAADVAWSVAGRRDGAPARLSLHLAASLPFPPKHPYLDADWRARHACFPIIEDAPVHVAGWRLTCRRTPVAALPADWRRNADPWRAYLDADAAGAPCLTTPVAGPCFAPLGMGGQTRALGDLFTDRKTPVSLRAGWPVVVDSASGQVLWVCGIQPGHGARVTETTHEVLCLVWERNPLLASPGAGEEQFPAQVQTLPLHGEGRGGVSGAGICAPT